MLSIKVDDVEAFRNGIIGKQLAAKYGIRLSEVYTARKQKSTRSGKRTVFKRVAPY